MKKIIFAALLTLMLSTSCTDASWEKKTNYGNNFKVDLYSGGQLVRSWISSGKVSTEEKSDGYYFKDKDSGKLIEVSGTVVITAL